MEKKLYIIKENVLIAIMEMGTYTVAAPVGVRAFMGTQIEFEALKQKENISTTQYDADNSDGIEDVPFEEVK